MSRTTYPFCLIGPIRSAGVFAEIVIVVNSTQAADSTMLADSGCPTIESMEQLFDLPVHRTHRWIFNCYALTSGEHPVLVDPGLPSVGQAALEGLRRMGHEAADLGALVCTHAHPDHLGGMPGILEAADIDVHLPGRCEAYLDGERPRSFGFDDNVRFLPMLAEEKFSFATLREFAKSGRTIGFGGPKDLTLPFAPSGFMRQGDDAPGMPGWEVVEAPGHSDDSICFYHSEARALLSGDAVISLDGRAWFNPEWVDSGLSDQTEEFLRSLDVQYLLPGHGRPLEGPDIWSKARSFRDRPEGKGILARCSRRFGKWAA
jgi:glyoxylase-like metal-dependent hydrolase (beta-lactamase superfamily II)